MVERPIASTLVFTAQEINRQDIDSPSSEVVQSPEAETLMASQTQRKPSGVAKLIIYETLKAGPWTVKELSEKIGTSQINIRVTTLRLRRKEGIIIPFKKAVLRRRELKNAQIKEISEADVELMRRVTIGDSPSEIEPENRQSVDHRLTKLRSEGVDFPKRGEWQFTAFERRIIDRSRDGNWDGTLEGLQRLTGIKINTLATLLWRLRSKGADIGLWHKRKTGSKAERARTSGRTEDKVIFRTLFCGVQSSQELATWLGIKLKSVSNYVTKLRKWGIIVPVLTPREAIIRDLIYRAAKDQDWDGTVEGLEVLTGITKMTLKKHLNRLISLGLPGG